MNQSLVKRIIVFVSLLFSIPQVSFGASPGADTFPQVSTIDEPGYSIDANYKSKASYVQNKAILDQYYERGPVLISAPLDKNRQPRTWNVQVKGSVLKLSVRPHNNGDSGLKILANGKVIFEREFIEHVWHDLKIALPEDVKEIEILHYATGWYWEFLFFSALETYNPTPQEDSSETSNDAKQTIAGVKENHSAEKELDSKEAVAIAENHQNVTAFSGSIGCPEGGCGKWDYILYIHQFDSNQRKAIFNFKKVDGFGRISYGSVAATGTYNDKDRTFVFTELFEPQGEKLRKEVLALPFSCELNDDGSQLTVNSNKENEYYRSIATNVSSEIEPYFETPSIPADILPLASVKSVYSELTQKIKCNSEKSSTITEFGHAKEGFFCKQKKAAGYGVWVKPFLYVWANRDEVLLKKQKQESEYKKAIAYRDKLIEDYQKKVRNDAALGDLNKVHHLVEFYSSCLDDVTNRLGANLVLFNLNTCTNELKKKQQDAEKELRKRKYDYNSALSLIRSETETYKKFWESEIGAVKLQKYPVKQTPVECYQQAITEKGEDLTSNDVESCIRQFNAHVDYINSEENKIQRKREAEEQRKREMAELSVFKDNLHLAAENNPEDVLKAAKIANHEYLRTIKIGGNRVDIYDTSKTNAMAPMAYAIFVKQGKFFKKELLASIIYWMLPPEDDSQEVKTMGAMGPLGLLGLGKIVLDRNKFQADLLGKYGPPSKINNIKATDLEEGKVNGIEFLLSGAVSGLLSGNNNTVWIRDGGKTLLALQNAKTLHPLLMHNLPQMYENYYPAAVKGLEFINAELYKKATENTTVEASTEF